MTQLAQCALAADTNGDKLGGDHHISEVADLEHHAKFELGHLEISTEVAFILHTLSSGEQAGIVREDAPTAQINPTTETARHDDEAYRPTRREAVRAAESD